MRRLRRMGLDGDVLAAGAGSLESARYLAGLGQRQVREFEDLYDRRERVTAQAGRLAGNAAYGENLRKQTRELQQANRRLNGIERAVKNADKGNRAATPGLVTAPRGLSMVGRTRRDVAHQDREGSRCERSTDLG